MPRPYRQKITPEERAAIARANVAARYSAEAPALKEPRHTIQLVESVYKPVNAKRGQLSWSDFIARLAGLAPRPDRRHIRKDGTFSPPKS